MSIRDDLLSEIDAFRARHDGMTDTDFGVAAMNDRAWLHRLRAGKRGVMAQTVDKVRAFMASYDQAAERKKRRARPRQAAAAA